MSTFRKIQPSHRDGSGFTAGSTSNRGPPRGSEPLLPSSGRRRRCAENVTRNACRPCQKARSKCDGKDPCRRCCSRKEASLCIYEAHMKQKKEELLNTINDLKAQDRYKSFVLDALRDKSQRPVILEHIENGERYENIGRWLGSPRDSASPQSVHNAGYDASSPESASRIASIAPWTRVTSDESITNHLFELYFAWVHPVHTLFRKYHFVKSYRQQTPTCCSSVLVNAICSMACHFHTPSATDAVNFDMLGKQFREAAQAELNPKERSLLNVQAFAIMFLVNIAQSKALHGSTYLRVATELLAEIEVSDIQGLQEDWKDTLRGVRNLEIEWAQVTCQASRMPDVEDMDVDVTEDTLRPDQWFCYRQPEDSAQIRSWPGFYNTTNIAKSRLMSIVRDITILLYSLPTCQISVSAVIHEYNRLAQWKNDLPAYLTDGDESKGRALLPHMLSLQLLFSQSVLHLLRPLVDLATFQSSEVNSIVSYHAQNSLRLLEQHNGLQCPWRYHTSMAMFALLHFCDLLIRFSPLSSCNEEKTGAQAAHLGMDVLIQSEVGHPISGTLQKLLRRTAADCSISLAGKGKYDEDSSKTSYCLDVILDACSRPTYVQPVSAIHMRYVSTFSDDWKRQCSRLIIDEGAASRQSSQRLMEDSMGQRSLMQIRNLLNETA